MDIGLTNKRYIGTEGCNVTVCAKILKGSIERTVSVHVFTFSGTAIGKCYGIIVASLTTDLNRGYGLHWSEQGRVENANVQWC